MSGEHKIVSRRKSCAKEKVALSQIKIAPEHSNQLKNLVIGLASLLKTFQFVGEKCAWI